MSQALFLGMTLHLHQQACQNLMSFHEGLFLDMITCQTRSLYQMWTACSDQEGSPSDDEAARNPPGPFGIVGFAKGNGFWGFK